MNGVYQFTIPEYLGGNVIKINLSNCSGNTTLLDDLKIWPFSLSINDILNDIYWPASNS